MGLLAGRSVVVTGGGRGLGRAFALDVARAGAAVVVNDIDVTEAERVVAEIEAFDGRAIASGASVADWTSAGELIDTCVAEFGAIDGLVNNAVAYPFYGPPWEEDGAQIRAAVEVNLLGVLFCGAHAMRHMTAARRGSIVNVTSRSMCGIPGGSTYGATKGGIASATYGWAIETQPYGVRVNALAPAALTRGHDLAGRYGAYAKSQALPPERVAPAVVYLLSDLSAELNGQVVALLGGKLGVMTPPTTLDDIVERDEWTPETIAEMFDGPFRQHRQPVGLLAAVEAAAAEQR